MVSVGKITQGLQVIEGFCYFFKSIEKVFEGFYERERMCVCVYWGNV